MPVTPFQQNCTLLWDEATKAGPSSIPAAISTRIEAGIAQDRHDVEKILLTHGHIDHAGGAAELKDEAGGIPIEGPHAADRFLLDDLAKQGRAYGIPACATSRPTAGSRRATR